MRTAKQQQFCSLRDASFQPGKIHFISVAAFDQLIGDGHPAIGLHDLQKNVVDGRLVDDFVARLCQFRDDREH
ncbi:hypothetical protein D9M72_557180 [compost metagenome]